ncbi:MAG: hypothetical protein H0U27_14205 [Nitrosopumilus sp.]|nr:hypothetical protein [Nitrosopumilus sp.]MBA3551109.1 hypothetical protein [Patescibacteria group bacterium]
MQKSKNSNKKVIVGVVAVLVVIAGVAAYKMFARPSLKSFYVNQSNLIVEANNMEKVEVFAQLESSNTTGSIGIMEVVEKNDQNDQTWIFVIPESQGTTTKIFAQGTTKEGKQTRRFTLSADELKKISRVIEDKNTSQAVLFGTVNSVTGNILSLNILASTTIRVTLVPNAQVTNKAGQKVLPSQLVRGGLVSVTGDFTDETSFTATEVAEENPQI